MFDLISERPRHPFDDPTAASVVVSVIGHGVILLAVVGASFLATGELPDVPDMMAFAVDAPAPPPPPAARRASPARPKAPVAGPSAAPVEAPLAIVAETITPWEESLAGVEGGVEGGVIGGTLGGVVGGLIEALPPPPPPPPPESPRLLPVRIGGQITAPALVHRVEPYYPEIASRAKITGIVILEATVDTNGAVESVRVLRSVNLLDKAAIEAVKQWRYSPLVLNGISTPFVLTVTLSFSLKDQ